MAALLIWSSFALASGQTLSAAKKAHLLDGPCVSLNSVSALPDAIKTAFASAMPGAKFAMADPGEEYQATDVIDIPNLPLRRLIFAAHCGDRWIVHYEHGGFVHNYDVLIVGGAFPPKFLWGGRLFAPTKNADELRKVLSLGKIYDDPQNYW